MLFSTVVTLDSKVALQTRGRGVSISFSEHDLAGGEQVLSSVKSVVLAKDDPVVIGLRHGPLRELPTSDGIGCLQ
jgi:hypothetical protein